MKIRTIPTDKKELKEFIKKYGKDAEWLLKNNNDNEKPINLGDEEDEQVKTPKEVKIERKTFKAVIKSIDKENHIINAIVSDYTIDRDKERFLPGSWKKHLPTYRKHAVLLSSHQYSDLRKQIGELPSVEETDKGLDVAIKYYAGEGNPEADWAWNLASKKMAMFSVGFNPFRSQEPEDEKLRDKLRREYLEQELLEVSQVVVGSNRNALQRCIEENGEYKETAELILKGIEEGILYEKQNNEPPKVKTDPPVVKPKIENDDLTLPLKLDDQMVEYLKILKSGRVISEKNRKVINTAITSMAGATTALKALLLATEKPKPEEDDDGKAIEDLNKSIEETRERINSLGDK